MTILILVSLILDVLIQTKAHPEQVRSPAWLTGTKFTQELDRPFSGSWTNIELRQSLLNISHDRRIAIVLDRRVDPTVKLPIEITNVPLRTGLTGISRLVSGQISVPENFVYLGPKSATNKLRTLMELRSQESLAKSTGISEKRQFELMRRKTFAWQDLDTPRQILESFAGEF